MCECLVRCCLQYIYFKGMFSDLMVAWWFPQRTLSPYLRESNQNISYRVSPFSIIFVAQVVSLLPIFQLSRLVFLLLSFSKRYFMTTTKLYIGDQKSSSLHQLNSLFVTDTCDMSDCTYVYNRKLLCTASGLSVTCKDVIVPNLAY